MWLELRRSISNQKNVERMIERSKKAFGMRIPRLESKGVGATNAPSDDRKKAYFVPEISSAFRVWLRKC